MNKKSFCLIPIAFLSFLICAPEIRANSWTNLGSGMNAYVEALAFDKSGNLYAAGEFTVAGGIAVNRIARWDGAAWTNLNGIRESGNIYELAFDSAGNLYAAGGNEIEKWNGTTWTNISAGMDWFVYALAADKSGNLYAGGSFTAVGGVEVNHVAKWNGTTWTNLGSGMDFYAEALACDKSGNLYAGGSFTNAGGAPANRIARWDGTNWTSLGNGIHSGTGDVVKALAFDKSGNLYAGGDFSVAGGVDAFAIAKWNGTTWTNLGSGMDFSVTALACDSAGNIYAGGNFNNAGGATANRIAKWNGASWASLGAGLNNSAMALACDASDSLYVAGYFSTAGGLEANHIAKWIPSPFGPVIKANGSRDDIIINNGDNLSVTVQIDPGAYAGIEADWWVVAMAGSAWYYWNNSYQWTPDNTGNTLNWRPVYQGPLGSLPEVEVLSIGLGPGSYTFFFAVDYPMDGVLNLEGPILVDAVKVTVP
ncbi:MAG: hypothetical protein PHP98_11830 [Kiritimatiellae bacterium]|nr:hypothetical protein [Kiritimatiellia bacterium]